ncbi:MAG: TonB-dependent outer membrane protein SusC/RagA [Gemmatimonadetes bacterium]|jgi:TonB-linked SusC/RagA family outer membrane protein|nr:TonB-dependent outer membrane protein SusC/RagA [Gemmatimonadota bacterium]
MEKTLPDRRSVWLDPLRGLRALGASMLLGLALSITASAQQIAISGTVTSSSGAPLGRVAVGVLGSTTRAVTTDNGRYSITAPSDGVLTFVSFGRKPQQAQIGGRTRIDVQMSQISYLEEVVVTAYTEQRRGDITGAVSSINIESAQRPTSASILQRLDAVPGISVASNGSPGSRSTVRIRGISSFQNNDPLYVIDGVPVQDSYINFINPNDISSIQVLKDASSASIYGSRASNGVILIETIKRGAFGPPKMTASMRTGYASPVNGYDKFLVTNSLDYFAVEKASYEGAGLKVPTNIFGDPNNPTVPTYTYAAPGTGVTTNAFGQITGVDLSKYSYPNTLIQLGSPGTNWWDAVFGKPGRVGDYNLSIAGAGADNGYGVSFNYFDQDGTAAYTNFKRANVRVNTQFNRGKLQFGENVALSGERHFGGLPDDQGGETGLIGKNILSQPVVAVYDAMGNFASGKAVGLGNNTNPLKVAYEGRNNVTANNRVFGNVFTGLTVNPYIALRTSLGFSAYQRTFNGYTAPTPENAEATFSNAINENQNTQTDWTWSNTAKFNRQYNRNGLSLLVGQEAQHSANRQIQGSEANLLSSDLNARYIQDALGDAKSKVVNSFGGESALLSYFGKADYNFADKYILSGTVRRDGSSRLGPTHQWGTFPAVGLGWRISKESFLENNRVLSDVMLRAGYGITGNQSIPSGRTLNQFGGSNGDTYYDINGSNTSVQSGFREVSIGNANLKWEKQKSTNIGADLALFDNAISVVFDWYTRTTDDLLYNPALPGTAGLAASPIVNIGKINNKGYDFSVGHQAVNWNVTFTGSHYDNKIESIDGVQTFFLGSFSNRVGNISINQLGAPIGSFFGLQSLGFFRDAADVAASASQTGAAPGRIKFADTNGDKVINDKDRVIIGNPHPKFTGGLDLGYRRGNWDLNGTFFGSYGNKIFESQKDFYVFQDFFTNVRSDLLANSWTPTNLNAKYPKLDNSDTYSKAISSYYVEDGSYTRLRNLQLGYTLPQSMSRYFSNTRVYVQGENLFTITGYPGLDPSLPKLNTTSSLGDNRDQAMGIDSGVYPSSRTISIGFTTSF